MGGRGGYQLVLRGRGDGLGPQGVLGRRRIRGFLGPETNSPTVTYAADAAPGLMKWRQPWVDWDSEVGGGPKAVGSTSVQEQRNQQPEHAPSRHSSDDGNDL